MTEDVKNDLVNIIENYIPEMLSDDCEPELPHGLWAELCEWAEKKWSKEKPTMRYVVSVVEHMRDGKEDWAKVFDSVEGALAYANKHVENFGGGNMDFALYELGKMIPLTRDDVIEPQPPKTQKRFKVVQP